MIREPSRRAALAVRGIKAAATSAAAVVALALTLGGAIASPGGSSGPPGSSTRLAERVSDARCVDAAGKTIVRTRDGETKAVSFERGWRVYRGQRPGTLLVVCPE
jgi:hypothetical protein